MQEQDQSRPSGGEPAADTPPPPPPASSAPPPPAESTPPPPPAAATSDASAPGLVYADVPNRAIAYVVDAIILFVINLAVGLIIGLFLTTSVLEPNYAYVLVVTLIGLAINALYFVYTWTRNGGSPGQRLLGMKVTNPDGAAVTQDQAIKRWIFLGAPFGLASALNPIPGLGWVIALVGLAYFIYLLVSTAQSPTKQGFHDKQANTIVVKSARSVS